jgi:hypothetical protein
MLVVVLLSKNTKNIWQQEYPFGAGLALAGVLMIAFNYFK